MDAATAREAIAPTPTARPRSALFRPGSTLSAEAGTDLETSARATRARTLWAELRSRPPAARPLAIAAEPRFARPELVKLLIAESFGRRFDDAAAAADLARLAVAAAVRIEPGEDDGGGGGARELADLRAEAAAALGNALRIGGDPREADRAFAAAGRHLAAGTGDSLLAARLADLEASLRKDQQRFADAHRLLAAAIAAYRDAGLADWVARSLVKLGSLEIFEGRPESALRSLREAVPLLRPEADAETFVICAHNVVNCLNRTGYSIAARSLVADLRRLHERLGDALNLLRLAWLEAQIDLELGVEERAERSLLAVRQGFVDRELPYFAALVSLELAEIYARRKDPFKMQWLAREMLPIFQSQQIHREATAALIVFREAVAMREASVTLIRDVARFLRDSQRDRSLRFRPRG